METLFNYCIFLVLLPPPILRDLFLSSVSVLTTQTETLNPGRCKAFLTFHNSSSGRIPDNETICTWAAHVPLVPALC